MVYKLYHIQWSDIEYRGECKGSYVVHVKGHKHRLDVGVWWWWQVLQPKELLEFIKSEKSGRALGHEFPVPLVALAGLELLHRSRCVSHGCFSFQHQRVKNPARSITGKWCIHQTSRSVCEQKEKVYRAQHRGANHVSVRLCERLRKSDPICSTKTNYRHQGLHLTLGSAGPPVYSLYRGVRNILKMRALKSK